LLRAPACTARSTLHAARFAVERYRARSLVRLVWLVRLVRLVRQARAEYSSRVSKAFTRESDDAPVPPAQRRGVPVPVPNYMTPAGARAARQELAGYGAPRGIDEARARELAEHLATAQIVEPPADRGVVGLGATVTIERSETGGGDPDGFAGAAGGRAPRGFEDAAGKRTRYRIVGALEADPRRGLVFWQSPLAEALYGARVGDAVSLPRGVEAEVIAVDYE
jgi:transcription elongation factor GreB